MPPTHTRMRNCREKGGGSNAGRCMHRVLALGTTATHTMRKQKSMAWHKGTAAHTRAAVPMTGKKEEIRSKSDGCAHESNITEIREHPPSLEKRQIEPSPSFPSASLCCSRLPANHRPRNMHIVKPPAIDKIGADHRGLCHNTDGTEAECRGPCRNTHPGQHPLQGNAHSPAHVRMFKREPQHYSSSTPLAG